MGHAGVKAHLARFRMIDNPMCNCAQHEETIDHLLHQCHLHAQAQTNLSNKLTLLNIDQSVKIFVGGGPFPPETQVKIIKATIEYLKEIKALKQM